MYQRVSHWRGSITTATITVAMVVASVVNSPRNLARLLSKPCQLKPCCDSGSNASDVEVDFNFSFPCAIGDKVVTMFIIAAVMCQRRAKPSFAHFPLYGLVGRPLSTKKPAALLASASFSAFSAKLHGITEYEGVRPPVVLHMSPLWAARNLAHSPSAVSYVFVI